MKWYIFKYLLILLCLNGGGNTTFAQTRAEKRQNKHERLQEQYQSRWNKLVPRYNKFQFAGGMGLFSLGMGWDYGKKKQWETDILLGYLPKFDGKEHHITITLKENYIPWKIRIKNSRWVGEPFTASIYINKIFGEEFWTKDPDKYPDKYYNVATNLRFNIAFGQRIKFNLKPKLLTDHITFFYEVGTNDLYVISYFTNKYLHLTDIFSLSLGLKFQFL